MFKLLKGPQRDNQSLLSESESLLLRTKCTFKRRDEMSREA